MNKKALITGASSGIGKALAVEFAKQGFDLLLTARNAERLSLLADELSAQFKTNVEVFAADLSKPHDVEELILFAGEHDISVLVNNAGFGIKETSLKRK